MSARSYLFLSKTTVNWCVGRYVATDHADNKAAWADLYPFKDNNGREASIEGAYAAYFGPGGLRDNFLRFIGTGTTRGLDPDGLTPGNWTCVDTTEWWQFRGPNGETEGLAVDQQRNATMNDQQRAFVEALTPDMNTIQWAHIMDPELASAWLRRAMKVTPGQLDALEPEAQFNAITSMWAAFAQYWKAVNVSPQSWARYRAAWEFNARPANTQIVLRSPDGAVYPRPCSAPIWAKTEPGEQYPESAPKYLGPWRWEAAMLNDQWGQGRTSHTKFDANVTVRFGHLGQAQAYLNDTGASEWGGPISLMAVGSSDATFGGSSARTVQCQDMVQYGGFLRAGTPSMSGGTCFAPMAESHMFWVDAGAMLSGGMAPFWTNTADASGFTNLWFGQSNSPLYGKVESVAAGRRNRYAWCLVRCEPDAPDTEKPAADYYERFDKNLARGDWSRSREPAGDILALKGWGEAPRLSGPMTWRDGVLGSVNPMGAVDVLGRSLPRRVGWPVTGVSWANASQSQSGSLTPDQWAFAAPHNLVGYSPWAAPFNTPGGETGQIVAKVFWQPPAKRYVDLLWPLLEYLASKTPEEIAYEVKLDVMGKNGFSLFANGAQGASNAALIAAQQQFNTAARDARREAQAASDAANEQRFKVAKTVMGLAQAATSIAVSFVATPAAGAVVSAGFGLLNGILQLAVEAGRDRPFVTCGKDVFGRMDGIYAAGATNSGGPILGNFDKYAIHNITEVGFNAVSNTMLKINQNMRFRSRLTGAGKDTVDGGWYRYPDDFVSPATTAQPDPYPAGMRRSVSVPLVPMAFLPGLRPAPRQVVVQAQQAPRRLVNLDPVQGMSVAIPAAGAVLGLAAGFVLSSKEKNK